MNQKDLSADPKVDLNVDTVYLSHTFKIWVVGIIFFLIFFHLFTLIAFPNSKILSDKFILTIVLGLISYLWTQELRDRYCLQEANEALIHAQKKLQNAEIDAISSLVLMEEAKDLYVHGHSSRVTEISLQIAEYLGFLKDTREVIQRACILHDIGKLAIKDEILLKPGKLTDEEWKVIKQHPKTAMEILEPLEFLFLEKKIILHHHERIDGAGYPDGLKGRYIPAESRIIAVADTFDAMNSTRIYREPCSKEQILEELNRVAGSQLDSEIVNVFLKVLDKNPGFWERSVA